MIKWKLLTATGNDSKKYIGEKEYLEAANDLEFQVPAGVRRIHVCCIGAGGAGGTNTNQLKGGGGGGLAWANNIIVEPGEKLKVKVGSPNTANNSTNGDSSVSRGSDVLIKAQGGDPYGYGGDPVFGDGVSGGGGTGGEGSAGSLLFSGGTLYGSFYGGGGGAAGYMGNGGRGPGGAPDAGSGGGSAGTHYYRTNGIEQGSRAGGVGGGVGIKGRGSDGAAVEHTVESVKPGLPGSGGDGSKYGGGGSYGSGAGGGAVRIIWGIKFSYPDNADIEAVE